MLQNDVSGYHKITLHQANILHHEGVLTSALRTFKDRHFLSDEHTFTDRSVKVLLIFKNLDSFSIIVLSLLYLFALIKSAVVRLLFCSVKGIFYLLCLYVTSWCYKTFATFHKHTCLLHQHERYFTEVFYLRINSHTPVR